ncbi:MAG: LysR family transcriptional regulator [Colwellia sp.]|nr:LysR family transcriptional regulator [Colwellia sp.]
MDLRTLKYFVFVYEQQSFSAAAKLCFVAQPSISSAVAQLEQSLNTQFFIRYARGVKPSKAGERLYPLAKQLLGQADAIKTLFTDQSIKQPFYLGVTKGLGVERMSALLKDFTASQNLMELTLVSQNQTADARIIIKEELDEKEHFISLWQEDYKLALPYNHVLSLKENITLSDLDGLPFIHRNPCTAWNSLNDTLTLAGFSVDIRAKIQTIDYALGLVHAGLGCALVPAHPEVLNKSEIVFREIEGLKLMREIVFAYQQSSPVIEKLKSLVINHRQNIGELPKNSRL